MAVFANAHQYINRMLLEGVFDQKFDVVKDAVESGANVNGDEAIPPIAAATMAEHAGIVEFLLEKGADPDRPVTVELPCPALGSTTMLGERALHLAARTRNVGIVRLLLEQSGADINATDNKGRTPLMITCESSPVCAEVVRLLLQAGADPTLAQKDGYTPMHAVAESGHLDLVDMVHSRAPATLNRCSAKGETPLYWACCRGHKSVVSRLLSLGAMQPTHLDEKTCPLRTAVNQGFASVVRVLVSERGIRAIGDKTIVVPGALYMAVRFHPRVLLLLLTVDGEEGRSDWANYTFNGSSLLHVGVGYCCPAGVSVLLGAGADEAWRDSGGRTARDAVGLFLGRDGLPQMDQKKEVAVRRMLLRAPAYRARSWAWPSDDKEAEDAGGSGNGDAADVAAAAAAVVVLSPPPAMKTPPVVGVRVFRPTEKNSRKFFVRLIGRYCAKGKLCNS